MPDFFTVVAADLILFAVAISAFVSNVVATVASFVLLLTVTSQMTNAITFVALLA